LQLKKLCLTNKKPGIRFPIKILLVYFTKDTSGSNDVKKSNDYSGVLPAKIPDSIRRVREKRLSGSKIKLSIIFVSRQLK